MAQPNAPQPAEVRPADPVETQRVTLRTVEKGLADSMDVLRATLGSRPQPVPDTINTEENADRRGTILRGGFDDAGEVYEFGMLRLEQQRSQMQKEIRDGKPVDPTDLIAVSQGQTYHEYLPLLLHSLQDSMTEYRALRQTVPAAVLQKPDVARAEVVAQLTLSFLDAALKERVGFANVLVLEQALRHGYTLEGNTAMTPTERAVYEKRRDDAVKTTSLRAESLAALKGDEKTGLEHSNLLNQRILDVLSGKTLAARAGDVGFYPQAMTLELLTSAYEYTLEQERRVLLDPANQYAEARLGELEAIATKGGVTLPKDLKEEYDALAKQQRNRKGRLQDLEKQRAGYLEELLKKTDDLGRFQIRAEELTAIQRQFGRAIDPLAGPRNKQEIPDVVKQKIDENMTTRKQFHLDRIDAFLGTLEDGVLSIAAGEQFEDFNNKNLRPIALKVVEALAGLASLPAPESFNLKKRIRNAIAGDLEDAMGIPKNADGSPKNEKDWTPDERANVEKKAKSVIDAINEFRYRNKKNADGKTEYEKDAGGNRIEKDHTKKLRSTIGAIRAMPAAKKFVGQPVHATPTERVSAENLDAMITAHGGPAVYVKLIDQMLDDWGTVDGVPPDGVIGESADMMRKIDDVVGTHIKVGEAEIQLAQDTLNVLYYACIGMGILIVVHTLKEIKGLFSGSGLTEAELKDAKQMLVDAVDREKALADENMKLKAGEANLPRRAADAEVSAAPSKKIDIGDGRDLGTEAAYARESGVDVQRGRDVTADPKADVDARGGNPPSVKPRKR